MFKMYIIVRERWLVDRSVTFGVMVTVTRESGEAEELHTILFLFVHIHTLKIAFPK